MFKPDRDRLLSRKKKLMEEKALLEANAKADALIAALGVMDKEAQMKFWLLYSSMLTHEPYKTGFENINRSLAEIVEELNDNGTGKLC